MSEDRLVTALRRCSLHPLLLVVSQVLARSGFGDVQILDRRENRQRSRHGGHELLCLSHVGTLPARIAVKVVRQDVRVRMLDELAGAVLRTGCDLGLVVTPYDVAGTADRRRGVHAPARVEALDGRALARLLAAHRIGVDEDGRVDEDFFDGLEDASARLREAIREVRR